MSILPMQHEIISISSGAFLKKNERIMNSSMTISFELLNFIYHSS